MIDVFGNVKGLLKFGSISIDNNVFRLHYKASVIVLVSCSLLVTSKQYLGDPIDCIVEEIPQKIMDTYCWIHSTYSIPSMVDGEEGHDVAHPGVAPNSELSEGEEFRYHKYYQWVCFTLFFQALMFYIPRYIWKAYERGIMKMLVGEMTVPIVDTEKQVKQVNNAVSFFTSNYKTTTTYAWVFFFCEILNFINVVVQIFFTDLFLGHEFTEYGGNVLKMSELPPDQRTDPMALVFPKVTKCTFNKYGPSGTVELFDGLCILPLNIINEKIYIFLWFWFILVAAITGFELIFRLLTFIPFFQSFLLRLRARNVDASKIKTLCERKKSWSDWFILYQMGKNMDPIIFHKFIEKLYRETTKSGGESEPLNPIN